MITKDRDRILRGIFRDHGTLGQIASRVRRARDDVEASERGGGPDDGRRD
jgi:hypothetical protein